MDSHKNRVFRNESPLIIHSHLSYLSAANRGGSVLLYGLLLDRRRRIVMVSVISLSVIKSLRILAYDLLR